MSQLNHNPKWVDQNGKRWYPSIATIGKKYREALLAHDNSGEINLVQDFMDEITNIVKTEIAELIKKAPGNTSDGYHTFRELYRYRMLLQAGWFNNLVIVTDIPVVKSWRHSDGELCFGKENYFVVAAQFPTGQVTNHYKGEFWDLFRVPEVEKAPEWDGHTAQVAAQRMEDYIRGSK